MQATFEFPFMTLSLLVLFIGGLLIYLMKGSLEKTSGKIAVGISAFPAFLMVPPLYRV